MLNTTTTRAHLIDALVHEYEFLLHDDFTLDLDDTPDEYRAKLATLSDAELIAETCTDDELTLDEYITNWL